MSASSDKPLDRDQIVSLLRERKPVLDGFRVRSLSLFGSAVRGEARPDSDLDFVVEFDGPATYKLYSGLKMYLEDLSGRRVDLVTKKALKPRMRSVVEREAIRVA